ncbi:hypothetical protein PBI_COOPER_67 [Mycobacterium phage Cooper]|uniref:Uncharacterized protein n=1 Tax=Mycobacterium phage Cooper TaxID=373406 RepID=Q1A049_9CAUD|nr:virion structural protein [Mycobacterium phage Cooper]ABD58184.1 hypothetical protein PBI_COOPER_67 [Mycobacterium phage Cooper]
MTVIAPGGWRLLTEYVYEFTDVENYSDLLTSPLITPDPLALPYITITRGGIRYPVGPVRRYRWHARTRWGRRIKRVLFGVQWVDQ